MLTLSKTRFPKQRYANKEYCAGGFIPYKYMWNNRTVLMDDDSFLQVIKISGFSFETADDEDVDVRKNVRNLLLKGVSDTKLTLYFHMIRSKQVVFKEPNLAAMPEGFASMVELQWYNKHKSQKSYVNEMYLTVIRSQKKTGSISFFENLIEKLQQKADKSVWKKSMQEGYEEMEETVSRIASTLRDYKPEILGARKEEHGYFSDVLEFLGRLVNGGAGAPMTVPTMDISRYLPLKRLYFGFKAIEIKSDNGSKFGGILSVREYCPNTAANMFDGFLQMPFELIISQSFVYIDRASAINSMKVQQGRMIAAGDSAVSQVVEINEALDDAMSGRIAFGKHHMTIFCLEQTPKSLENAIAMASTEIGNSGIMPVREKVNLEPAFWAQLPGNQSYAVRAATVNTLNVASMASYHNYPTGKPKGNFWGDAVTVLDTTSGTPFYFSFHVRDVGHTMIIGPTGAGKTVLMNFLCAQARKFKCRMFFFDKDRGAEIFLKALGGTYVTIDPSKKCKFNPFKLEDNGDNRNFLSEWLQSLATVHEKKLTPEDLEKMHEAIVGNYKLSPEDRTLTNVVPFLGLGGAGSLASRVAMWHGEGSHSNVFDNEEDSIDFEKNLVYGFEMGELLKDAAALGPVLLYIFHRIRSSLDGTPTMIVLDEAWALIDNDVFAPKIKDWLKVLRKLNCFVIFATQSVEDASKSQISDTLVQQTATQIYLPNLRATDVYRTSFMLTQREFTLIKTTDPSSRFFLVKQGTDAVVARIDLSGMNDVINVLSGRAETVILLDEVIAEVGEDPDVWLPVFIERVRYL